MARKVLINLTTGLEDPERVTVAFLVGGAAIERGEIVAMWLTRRRCASRCPDTPRRSHATAARHSRDCLSSTPTAAARSWSVRSAGTPASSTRAPWFRTPASPAQHPCSNGSGMIKPRSSATDRGARDTGGERRTSIPPAGGVASRADRRSRSAGQSGHVFRYLRSANGGFSSLNDPNAAPGQVSFLESISSNRRYVLAATATRRARATGTSPR